MPVRPLGGSRAAAAAALPRHHGSVALRQCGSHRSRSPSAWQHSFAAQRVVLAPAAADNSAEETGSEADTAANVLPLWRFLQQQGFSADSLSRMQSKITLQKNGRRYTTVSGRQMSEEQVQRDVAPNMTALRAEGLDTASIQRIFEQHPKLLTATHITLSSALAALRQLAALLPADPRSVQAPPGATQLGVALWLYPAAAARLLAYADLGSLIEGNLRLRQRLGISDAQTAVGLFKDASLLVSNFDRAEAMVAHLQRLQASGALSSEHGEQSGRRELCSICLLSVC